MFSFFSDISVQTQSAIISAVVTLIVLFITTQLKYFYEKKSLNYKLNTEYEYERKKEIKILIGTSLGVLTDACQSFSYRMFNLYENNGKGWLKYNANHDNIGYYMKSMIYRFTRVMHHAKKFEGRELYVDSRKLEENDMLFVYFVRSILWVMSDIKLFDGIEYDYSKNRDHFYSDEFRSICKVCDKNGAFPDIDEFSDATLKTDQMQIVVNFFDDLCKNEKRYRWDRLVCLHLIILSFLNAFGDKTQKSSFDDFVSVASQINNNIILTNLKNWLSRLGFDEYKQMITLKEAIR